jgi:hypothetical protein
MGQRRLARVFGLARGCSTNPARDTKPNRKGGQLFCFRLQPLDIDNLLK